MTTLTAEQARQIADLVRPGETVQVTVVNQVAMVEVYSGGALALLEIMGPRQDTPHLYLTDFGVKRPPREREPLDPRDCDCICHMSLERAAAASTFQPRSCDHCGGGAA